MSDIANGVIQVLDQLKGSGQLNDYLIDDDERKWTKLVYDIMVNKFDMPFGKGTMQQASDIFNNAVRIWKGKNKLGNMMNMESKQTNKKLIRLTESDLHNIVKESVNKILSEMDWRTYANAGKKAHDEVLDKMKRGTSLDDLRKDSDFMKRARQTRKFRDQAVASSRDKFKELNDDENDFYTTVGPDDTYYANVENDSWGRPMVADKDGKTKMQGLSRPKMVNVNPERYFGYGNNEKVSDWNKFSKEINDFNSGKSKYVKGKGWE